MNEFTKLLVIGQSFARSIKMLQHACDKHEHAREFRGMATQATS
jgi:hypothetical protein